MECDAKKATVEHEIGTCRLGCTLAMEFPGLYGGRLPVACWKQLRRDPIVVLFAACCSGCVVPLCCALCVGCRRRSALGDFRHLCPCSLMSSRIALCLR